MLLGLNTGNPNGLSGKLLSQTRYKGGLRFNGLFGPWGDFTDTQEKRDRLNTVLQDAYAFSAAQKSILVAFNANRAHGNVDGEAKGRRLSLHQGVSSGQIADWRWWLEEFDRVLRRLDGWQDVAMLSIFNGPEDYGAYWNVGDFNAKRRFMEFTALLIAGSKRHGWDVAEDMFEQVHVYFHNDQWSQAVEQLPIPMINATDYGHPVRVVTEWSVHGGFPLERRRAILEWSLVSVLPNIVGADGKVCAHDSMWDGAAAEYTYMEGWGKPVLDKYFPMGVLG